MKIFEKILYQYSGSVHSQHCPSHHQPIQVHQMICNKQCHFCIHPLGIPRPGDHIWLRYLINISGMPSLTIGCWNHSSKTPAVVCDAELAPLTFPGGGWDAPRLHIVTTSVYISHEYHHTKPTAECSLNHDLIDNVMLVWTCNDQLNHSELWKLSAWKLSPPIDGFK